MVSLGFLTYFYMSIDTFSHFAVPLFICISGFVLFNKYQGSYSLKGFYQKRFLSVVPQYTLFFVFSILFIYIGDLVLGRIWKFSLQDIIYQYFAGTAFYHLFFLVVIIQLYILYPVIERIFTRCCKHRRSTELLISLFALQILYIFFMEDIFVLGKAVQFLEYLPYFVLGMQVRSFYPSYTSKVMAVIHSCTCMSGLFLALLSASVLGIWIYLVRSTFLHDLTSPVIFMYKFLFAIVQPFYYILIFILCLFVALKIPEITPGTITRTLKIIGKYSFGIYLIHPFVLFITASMVLPKVGFDMNNWLFFPVVLTLVLGVTSAIVYLMNKVPYHEYVIGSLR